MLELLKAFIERRKEYLDARIATPIDGLLKAGYEAKMELLNELDFLLDIVGEKDDAAPSDAEDLQR